METSMADDLDDLTKDELQERARDAGVSESGTKEDIVSRLRDSEGDGDDGRSGSSKSGGGSARDAISVARHQLRETIGADIESVTSAQRDDESGRWIVEVQTVEARRIPPSSDVVAMFRVEISGDEMTAFERTARGRRDTLDIS